MVLCLDIAFIVVEYLEPLCLGNFFRENGLDKHMKFVYNGYGGGEWLIKCDELCVVLDEFPNMVLVGVMFRRFDNVVMQKIDRLGKLTHVGGEHRLDGSVCEILCKIMGNINACVDVIDVRECCEGSEMRKIIFANNRIKHFICGNSALYLMGLEQCVILERVTIKDDMYVSYSDFRVISLCQKLTHLDMIMTTHKSNDFLLENKNLCVLKITHHTIENLNFLGRCLKLRKLVIRNCEMLRDLSALWGKCPNLRKLVIRNCGEIEDFDIKIKSFGLRKLVISGCPKLEEHVDELRNVCVGIRIRIKV